MSRVIHVLIVTGSLQQSRMRLMWGDVTADKAHQSETTWYKQSKEISNVHRTIFTAAADLFSIVTLHRNSVSLGRTFFKITVISILDLLVTFHWQF